ncbi:MAG: hypothetical protein OHK0022_59800 [Roseiflexaceae bacterium]
MFVQNHGRGDRTHARNLLALAALLALVLSLVSFAAPLPVRAADLSANYTWKPLKIGGGGFVTGIAIHPTTANLIYVRTDVGGAYKWNNSTQTWSQILLANRVPNPKACQYNDCDYGIESLALSKTNDQVVFMAVGAQYPDNGVFTGTATGRILKSTNGGQSWSDSGQRWHIGGNNDERQSGERLAVDPNNGSVVYFGSRAQGLWVSTNTGDSWSQVSTSQIPVGSNTGHPIGVKFVVFDPNSGTQNGKTKRIYAGVTGYGIYRSDDAGGSWYRVYTTTDRPYEGKLDANGNLFFTLSSGGKVLKYSPSNGNTADITPSGAFALTVAIDPFNNSRLFVSEGGMRDGKLWRSTNGGSNWDTLDVALDQNVEWLYRSNEVNWLSTATVEFDPHVQNQLWVPQGMGVMRSNDLGDSEITWTYLNNGIEEMVAEDIVVPPGGKPVTVLQDRQGFYHENLDSMPAKSHLGYEFSSAWNLDYSGGTPSFIVAVISDARGCCGDKSYSGYSTDGGRTFTKFQDDIRANYWELHGGNIAVSASNTSNIIWQPTGWQQPFVTFNRGQTWQKIPHFVNNNIVNIHQLIWWGYKRALDSDKVLGGTFYIYAVDNEGQIHVTEDGGSSWVSKDAPSNGNNGTEHDAHVYGQLRAVPGQGGHVWLSMSKDGLYYSENKGDAWTKVSGVQEARSIGFGKAIGSYPTVFVYGKVSDQWGVYRSTDKGASWDLVAQYPGGIYDAVHTVMGDMDVAGRVYVGFAGNSFLYGDTGTPPSSNAIYTDAVATGWTAGAWNGSINTGNTSPVRGSKSVAVNASGSWGAAVFTRSSAAVSTSGLSAVKLWVHGGSSGTRQLQVFTNSAVDGSGTRSPSYNVDAPAGSWTEVTIPLSSLGSPSQIGYLAIQDRAGVTQPAFYIDDVELVGTTTSSNTRNGSWAAKVSPGATYSNLYQTAGSIATNTSYTASVYIKGSGSLHLRVLAGSWGSEITTNNNCTASGSWQACSVTFNTGSNTQLTFRITNPDGGATIYLDDAFLGQAGGTNRLSNPGFESGSASWGVASPITIVQNP